MNDTTERGLRRKTTSDLLTRMLRGDAGHAETVTLIDELYNPVLVADATTEQIADTARTDLEALRAEEDTSAPAAEKVAARPRARKRTEPAEVADPATDAGF